MKRGENSRNSLSALLICGLSCFLGLHSEDFILFTFIHEIGHIIAAGGGRILAYNAVAIPVKNAFVMAFGEVFLIFQLTMTFIILVKRTWAGWLFFGVLIKSFFTAQRLTDMSYPGAYELFLCFSAPLVAVVIIYGGSRVLVYLGGYMRERSGAKERTREFQEYLKVLKTVGF